MTKKNPVTLQDLKNCIPKHCFERSFFWSTYYLLYDLLLLSLVTIIYIHLVPQNCPSNENLILQIFWYFSQICWIWIAGSIATGLWVIGHECGHHAFCTSNFVNDFIGFFLHTLLLVPFFPWQYTHGRHHKNNNHLLDNETHVPATRKGFNKKIKFIFEILGENNFILYDIFTHAILGWPLYIFFGLTGSRRTPNGKKSKGIHTHFFPNGNAFPKGFPTWKIYLSTLGLTAVIYGLYVWAQIRSFSEVFRFYIGPYLVVNFWLVIYTWLHHSHPSIPHYGETEWTWLKGAKATIDRNYGIYDVLHHDIGSTHVCHHTFSKIPHYHAREATRHMKLCLGNEYNFTNEWWILSIFSTARNCMFVENVNGVQYYKGADDLMKEKRIKTEM